MNKAEIMRLSNLIINALQESDDGDFVDQVIFAICNAEEFPEEDIEYFSEEM